jgi:hypothetical protein
VSDKLKEIAERYKLTMATNHGLDGADEADIRAALREAYALGMEEAARICETERDRLRGTANKAKYWAEAGMHERARNNADQSDRLAGRIRQLATRKEQG